MLGKDTGKEVGKVVTLNDKPATDPVENAVESLVTNHPHAKCRSVS